MSRTIYLCTMDELAGPGASDERVLHRMNLLASVLRKLGWDLASGTEGRYHELWALSADDSRAEAFEKALISWIGSTWQSVPDPSAQHDRWWWVRINDRVVEFAVHEFADGDWRLSVLEGPPGDFTRRIWDFFEKPESDPAPTDDGRVATRFAGQDLKPGFPGFGDNTEQPGGSGG